MELLYSKVDFVRCGYHRDYSQSIDRQIAVRLFTRVFYRIGPEPTFNWFDKDFLRAGYKRYEDR